MTTAWYWHLRYPNKALWQVVLISWSIALLEYYLAVPANRVGTLQFTAFHLNTIQKIVSLVVFIGFAVLYLVRGSKVELFNLIWPDRIAVFFVFKEW